MLGVGVGRSSESKTHQKTKSNQLTSLPFEGSSEWGRHLFVTFPALAGRVPV